MWKSRTKNESCSGAVFFHPHVKGRQVQKQRGVGHEVGTLQFAAVQNVKLLVVVMD